MGQAKMKILDLLKEETISSEEAIKLLEAVGDDDGEEQMKVLDILGEATISADEAVGLLQRTGAGNTSYRYGNPQQPPHPPRTDGTWGQWFARAPFKPDIGWVDDLRVAVEDVVRDIGFPEEFGIGAREETLVSGEEAGESVQALVFEGKNAPVRLEAFEGGRLEVNVKYKLKENWDPRISLVEDNGSYALRYDESAVRSMGISVRVPKQVRAERIRLTSSNAPVSIDEIKAEKIELVTNNSTIKASDTTADRVYCKTSNASVTVGDSIVRELDVRTSNGKISLDDVDVYQLRLVTSNAKIEADDVEFAKLYAKTSNAQLRLTDIGLKLSEPLCVIDAFTSNGGINIELPGGDYKCRLRAASSRGGISSRLKDMVYSVNERNYAEAQSVGYEEAACKLEIDVQTSNGGIEIGR